MRRSLVVLVALSAVGISGCVVTPANGPYVAQPAPEPVYIQPERQRLAIAGSWVLVVRGTVVRQINVRRTEGGILIDRPGRGPMFAERIARGAFRDERGRVYQFTSSADGIFDNPNNGRRFRMRRPG